MKRKNSFIYLFTAIVLLGVTPSCKKFLDVNKNLNSPTPDKASVSLLLSSAERALANNMALGTGLGNTMSIYTHQMTGRVGADRYGAGSQGWDGIYAAIANLNVIIKNGTAETRFKYAGIAKILKAYAYSILVDVYGDVPFTEFDQFPAIKQPKTDLGKDIYPKLFTLIDEGIADIDNAASNVSVPGSDDYIYKGNTTNWKKAARTLKLKLYTQVRLVPELLATVTAQVKTLLDNPAGLISSQAESFMMPYGPFATTDDRHPAYGDYNATQRGGQLFSPWLYEIMKGKNANMLSGNPDPRVPYYIYNQKSANALPENCTEYRDGGFISILFGSNGNCRDGSNSATYSIFGIYPAGGRYEMSEFRPINANSGSIAPINAGTGARPHEFITYADRLYLEAELINAGIYTGDQKAKFTSALNESFKQVDYIITTFIKPGNAGAPQVVPLIDTDPATAVYKSAVIAAFDAGTNTQKLEHIITQKWINRIANPVDNYTDYRRTGFPILFSPAPVGNVTAVTAPDGKVTPVSNDRRYPLSLPFNNNEIALNSNAPPQKVPENYPVFWDK